jgi:hypothetical protein
MTLCERYDASALVPGYASIASWSRLVCATFHLITIPASCRPDVGGASLPLVVETARLSCSSASTGRHITSARAWLLSRRQCARSVAFAWKEHSGRECRIRVMGALRARVLLWKEHSSLPVLLSAEMWTRRASSRAVAVPACWAHRALRWFGWTPRRITSMRTRVGVGRVVQRFRHNGGVVASSCRRDAGLFPPSRAAEPVARAARSAAVACGAPLRLAVCRGYGTSRP